jgi:hypothetical protein
MKIIYKLRLIFMHITFANSTMVKQQRENWHLEHEQSYGKIINKKWICKICGFESKI